MLGDLRFARKHLKFISASKVLDKDIVACVNLSKFEMHALMFEE